MPEHAREAFPERAVLPYLAPPLRAVLARSLERTGAGWTDIRLRSGRPLMVVAPPADAFVRPDGTLSHDPRGAYPVGEEDLRGTLELVSGSSLYALEEELRQGFITLPGGHRVGLCGRAVLREGAPWTLREIGSLSVRIARQVPGAADAVVPWILGEDGLPLNTLVLSPPGGGKTTLLRDLARQLSRGRPDLGCPGLRVAVVDERLELAGGGRGAPTLDLGPRTDVLAGCPKAVGIHLLLRSMGPQVVVTDEVGRPEDPEALAEAVRSGVRVLASAHAASVAEAAGRRGLRELLASEAFGRVVRLGDCRRPGTVEEVRDASGRLLHAPGGRPGGEVRRWASGRC